MRLIVVSAVAAAILAVPVVAHAKDLTPMQQIEENKKKDREFVDKQYERTMQITKSSAAAPAKVDPWANMRGADDSKTKK